MRFTEMIANDRILKVIDLLFLGWLLTLPFGSHIGGLSLGFMTIYPNLIFTFLLLPFAFRSLKNWSIGAFSITGFLALWALLATFLGWKHGLFSGAVFDIRSLFMQLFVWIVIVTSFYRLGKVQFQRTLIIGLRIFFGIILLSGCFEFLTGDHFQGVMTDRFENMEVNNLFYAPLFLYDNPNDYLCYAYFTLLLLLIFDRQLRANYILITLFVVVLFMFSRYADSRFGNLISGILLLYIWVSKVIEFRKDVSLRKSVPYLIAVGLFVLSLCINPMFIGPEYKSAEHYRLNGIQVLQEDSSGISVHSAKEILTEEKQKDLIQYLDSVNTLNPENSNNLRLNLIKNGLEFIKESPVLGIGPGGFQKRHLDNEVKYPAFTQTSAHNFPIEIISQFGLLAWLYFGILAWMFIDFLRKRRQLFKEKNQWVIILFFVLPLLWLMPSAFLYQPINWILLPLLFCSLTILSNEHEIG